MKSMEDECGYCRPRNKELGCQHCKRKEGTLLVLVKEAPGCYVTRVAATLVIALG